MFGTPQLQVFVRRGVFKLQMKFDEQVGATCLKKRFFGGSWKGFGDDDDDEDMILDGTIWYDMTW